MTTFVLLVLMIQFLIMLIYSPSPFVTTMFKNLIQDGTFFLIVGDKNSTRWYSKKSVQIEDT